MSEFGLPADRAAAVRNLAGELSRVPGVRAVVLGGSRAVGAHGAHSDVDLGIYYEDEDHFDVEVLRALAQRVNDDPEPVVTMPWEWGRWVNGGAWLRLGGLRVDWIYRRASHVDEVLRALGRGEVEFDWIQQPPFGFASITYGGETHACVPLHDPDGVVADLKSPTDPYPEELRRSVAQNWTWAADFALRKGAGFAARGDVANTVGCLSRAVWFLAHVVHALARTWCFPESRLVALADGLAGAPADFGRRVDAVLAGTGTNSGDLTQRVRDTRELLDEVARTAGDLYRAPSFPL